MAKMEGVLRAVVGDAKPGESWMRGCQLEDQDKQGELLEMVVHSIISPRQPMGRRPLAAVSLGEASRGPQPSSGSKECLGREA